MFFKAIEQMLETYFEYFMDNQRRCNRGQGVIEYAGALVIAAVLVSLVLFIFPNPFTEFFFEMIEEVLNLFISYVPV